MKRESSATTASYSRGKSSPLSHQIRMAKNDEEQTKELNKQHEARPGSHTQNPSRKKRETDQGLSADTQARTTKLPNKSPNQSP